MKKKAYISPLMGVKEIETETVIALSTESGTPADSGSSVLVKGRDQFADDEEDIAAALAEQDNKVDDYGNLW